MQVKPPSHCSPREVAVSREETASLRLSLETEIDQFQLEEERKEQGELMIQVSDSKDELDRFSGVHTSGLVVTHFRACRYAHSQRFKGRKRRHNATREEEGSSRTPCRQGQGVGA